MPRLSKAIFWFILVLSYSINPIVSAKEKNTDIISDSLIEKIKATINLGSCYGNGLVSSDEKTEPRFFWCVASNELGKSELKLPLNKTTYFGLTTFVPSSILEQLPSTSGNWHKRLGDDAFHSLNISTKLKFSTSLSTLTLSPNYVRLAQINSEKDNEKKELECVRTQMIKTFTGDFFDKIQLPPFLTKYMNERETKTESSLLMNGKNWAQYTSEYGLFSKLSILHTKEFGDAYLVLEKASDGIFLNLFSIKNWQPSNSKTLKDKIETNCSL